MQVAIEIPTTRPRFAEKHSGFNGIADFAGWVKAEIAAKRFKFA
jgi:hypothetical protein